MKFGTVMHIGPPTQFDTKIEVFKIQNCRRTV